MKLTNDEFQCLVKYHQEHSKQLERITRIKHLEQYLVTKELIERWQSVTGKYWLELYRENYKNKKVYYFNSNFTRKKVLIGHVRIQEALEKVEEAFKPLLRREVKMFKVNEIPPKSDTPHAQYLREIRAGVRQKTRSYTFRKDRVEENV